LAFTGDYVHHYQPAKFAAIEAEVGHQPWVVCGLLRTTDAVTPSLTTGDVITSLAYIAVYTVIYAFALYYIYRLLRDGLRDDWQRHGGVQAEAGDRA
jgi:cytochrome bd-type quinol oxidase subunit 1